MYSIRICQKCKVTTLRATLCYTEAIKIHIYPTLKYLNCKRSAYN